jgi:hypothetical protein
MLVIGFGHRARQGKNTAALAFLNSLAIGCRVRMYAYADALRAEVQRVTREAGGLYELVNRGWFIGDDARLLGNCKVELPEWVKYETGKPRTLLQWWGTDYRRKQDPDYWVKRLTETLEREQPEVALITDVRFPNEADAIHAMGGKVVKVTRTTKADIVVPAHPSEDMLNDYAGWDYTLTASTVAELRKKSAALAKKITEGM